ncbi:Putative glycosyltransferase EpsH [Clostridiales bacterium CHKCI001]|nr:Putative glycosyltransferase EpsH [Clostridiales bacterium CHKCI001]
MNNQEIKVSVIVPVYNTEKYLNACLDSLVNQTLKEIEIILINDGSTDNSGKIIRQYENEYPQKFIVIEQENQGQACARNRGLERSRGIYIGFVDSDDIVEPQMFEKMYERAALKNADFVECDYGYYQFNDGVKNTLQKYVKITAKEKTYQMFLDPMIAPWNKIYKREIIIKSGVVFPERYIYEDTAFYIDLIPYIKTMEYIDEEYVQHYFRPNSTQTKKQNPRVGEMLSIVEQIILFYKKRGFFDQYFEELEYFCVKIMLCSSFGRIGMLEDKELRQIYMKKMLKIIEMYFKGFRKNKYFSRGIRNLYIKSFNKVTMHFYRYLIAFIYKRKMKL